MSRQPGYYNRPMALIAYVETEDSITNETALTPTVVWSGFGHAEPLAGKKVEVARQLMESAEMEFRIRYNPSLTVTTAMAMRYRDKDWPIGSAVNVGEANEEVQILAGMAK